MTQFERPRGTRDFGPDEMARRRALEDHFRGVAASFGYGEVQTPTFEHLELFTAKSGEAIEGELYAFKDKGDRELTLRPELTAPVIRYYLNELQVAPKPIRLFYIGNCFRYERPQKGRFREFTQFGCELIGAGGPLADAEVVAFAHACVTGAGVPDVKVRVGHIGLLRLLVDQLPCDDGTKARTYPLIDKGDEGLWDHLANTGAPEPLARAIERLAGFSEDIELTGTAEAVTDRVAKLLVPVRDLVAGVELDDEARQAANDHVDHVTQTLGALGSFGLEQVALDLGVARGLDYYTGLVFEIEAGGLGAQKQVCGGGAYTLTEVLGGQPTPTAGFAIGFDRVLISSGYGQRLEQTVRAHIAPIGADAQLPAARIARDLRAAGVNCTLDLMGRGPSKNLDWANSTGVPYVVLIGSRELEAGKATVKEMGSGEQEEVALDGLAEHLVGSG